MYPWVDPKDLDKIMKRQGYDFYNFGSRHNETDGAEDRLYMRKRDGVEKVFRLYGNRWDYRTFTLNGKHIDLTADLNILNEEDPTAGCENIEKELKRMNRPSVEFAKEFGESLLKERKDEY